MYRYLFGIVYREQYRDTMFFVMLHNASAAVLFCYVTASSERRL